MTLSEFFVGLVIVLVLIVVGYAAVQEHKQWDKFKVNHKCRIIERISPTVSAGTAMTVGPKGELFVTPITTVTPEKIAYLCNDGVTYWR